MYICPSFAVKELYIILPNNAYYEIFIVMSENFKYISNIDSRRVYKLSVNENFIESLKILNPRGIIFLHDVLPRSELEQTIPQKIDIWTGDVWKLILELIDNSKTLEIYIANIDCGVCMIKPKDNVIFGNTINYKNLSYEDFIERLYKKANILKSEDFIQKI